MLKGADGSGKISVESKEWTGDSRFVDNMRGTHNSSSIRIACQSVQSSKPVPIVTS